MVGIGNLQLHGEAALHRHGEELGVTPCVNRPLGEEQYIRPIDGETAGKVTPGVPGKPSLESLLPRAG